MRRRYLEITPANTSISTRSDASSSPTLAGAASDVAGLPDDRPFPLQLQGANESRPDHGVIIGDQNPERTVHGPRLYPSTLQPGILPSWGSCATPAASDAVASLDDR